MLIRNVDSGIRYYRYFNFISKYSCYTSIRTMISAAECDHAAKKTRVSKKIGTHNGTFHCDEALACYILGLTEKFRTADIVRTRDSKELATLDAAVDVGGVYDPKQDRYDHHQKGFDHVFEHGFATKLSSSGLVYKHYGREIISKKLGLDADHEHVERVYLALYKGFMEEIDAVDNGINQYDTEKPAKYIESTHLSARISRMNPDWMEQITAEKEDYLFQRAMKATGKEFEDMLCYYASSWLPARSFIIASIKSRHEVDPSGEILLLKRYCPWKEHIFELEKELNVNPLIKYVLYQNQRASNWRVQAVAVGPSNFVSRKPLPLEWRGLEGSRLNEVTNIDGSVFVHSSGFIGSNMTLDGALAMARLSLNL